MMKIPIAKWKTVIFGMASAAMLITVVYMSDTAIDYMKKGLRLCATTIVPSLFPFTVIADLAVSSGIGEKLSKYLSKPIKMIFGINDSGVCAYLIGLLFGAPIGARTAALMFDRGLMSRTELERILTFCNNPSSAFLINAVGISLLHDRAVGISLYICTVLSSAVIGVVSKFLFGQDIELQIHIDSSRIDRDFGVKSFTNAVGSSAQTMLTVCAYVVFFSSVIGCIGSIISRLGAGEYITSAVFGFFELSSGVSTAANISNRQSAIIACAAISGWSGLSVHMQIMSICSDRGLSFKPYFAAKAAQGVLCAVLTAVTIKFILPQMQYKGDTPAVGAPSNCSFTGLFICMIFFSASFLPIYDRFHRLSKSKNKKHQKNSKRA